MNECELSTVITAITNYLYCNLSKKDFLCATVILSELSKSMFSMALLRDVCKREEWLPPGKKGSEKDTSEKEEKKDSEKKTS